MRNTIMLALLMVVIVVCTVVNLIVFSQATAVRGEGPGQGGESIVKRDFIPPVERMIASHEEEREEEEEEEEEEEKEEKGEDHEMTAEKADAFHTISEPPKIHIFQTQYNGGTQIKFDHQAHVETLGLQCIQCHHVENCRKCHNKDAARQMTLTRGKEVLHQNCITCHAEISGPTACDDCHKQ